MRAAGNYNVDSIVYTGSRYERATRSNPDTPNLSRKVGQNVTVSQVNNLIDAVDKDTRIICIELVENAIALPQYQHPEKALYIFGPEDGNIEQKIIDQADDVVYIPTTGCMNLAATVNVVLYDRLAKSSKKIDDNELIRKSRDTNNNLKVRSD